MIPIWLVGGPWLFIFLWILASVGYRRSQGKEIIPRIPNNALFYEGWASGHSNRSFFTRVGGAHNCLSVAIVPDALIIRPRFPFNLMFLPEIYNWEHRIPSINLRSLATDNSFLGKSVELQFTDSEGGIQSTKLYLRRHDDFLATIGKISNVGDISHP
jgi:hypothetical protein